MSNVLVVGGTGFLGSAIARAAIADGDRVSVLSRRRAGDVAMSDAGLADVEVLTGDRHRDLGVLKGEHFDLVFDTCGYAPDAAHRLLDALDPFDGRYVFVSSASVYGDYSRPGLGEDADVAGANAEDLALAAALPLADRAKAGAYGQAYGPLKRACEIAAGDRLGDRALILRSGLLVGAGDYTDRLTWWLRRVDQGGSIPVPGPRDRPIQLIDVRDAAAFACRAGRRGLKGIYNLTSRPLSLAGLLESAIEITGAAARLAWIDQERVLAAGLQPWTEVPLWLPPDERYRHFFEIDVEKAYAAGLERRPLETTLAAILEWDRGRRDQPLRCGMSRAAEELLLAGA